MKRTEIIIREVLLKRKKVITEEDLRGICSKYNFDFKKTKIGLMNKGYLLTVLKGIYYLRDYNEKKTGTIKYSSSELLSLALELKGITNWYFGLNTALKMLNLTHEVFATNYVLTDRFNRIKPIKILESKYLFRKVKEPLFLFGIKKSMTSNRIAIKYSDTEKTLLDMAYLLKLSGKPEESIISVLEEYGDRVDVKKMLRYAKNYPKTLWSIVYEVFK